MLALWRIGIFEHFDKLVIVGLICSLMIASVCGHGPSRLQAQTLHSRAEVVADVEAIRWTPEGWQYQASSDPEVFRQVEVVRWGAWSGVQREQAVWLADGSWLCGKLDLQSDKVLVESDWFDPVEIPLASLRGIIFNPLPSLRDWQKLSQWMKAAAGTDDRVLLTSGQKIQGVIRVTQQAEEPSVIQVRKDAREFSWEQSDVRAVLFSPALIGEIPQKRSGQTLAISDGSLLHLSEPKAFRNRFKVETDGGLELVSIDSASRFSQEVQYLRVHDSGAQFLSDMTVAQYKYLPKLSSLQWDLGIDQDCLGRPLQVSRGIVPKGIAMHANSQVAFRWDRSAAKLLGEVRFVEPPFGGDRRLGAALCKVMVARNGKLETVAEYKLSRKRDAAGDTTSKSVVEIDVSNAQLIVMVVEEGRLGQLGDHIQWLDLRLERNRNQTGDAGQ